MQDLAGYLLDEGQRKAEIALPIAVQERERLYTSRELVQIDKVKSLHAKLAFPSLRRLIDMVRLGKTGTVTLRWWTF